MPMLLAIAIAIDRLVYVRAAAFDQELARPPFYI
jgi:hypothetical protein